MFGCEGVSECVREASGKDMEGKEESMEDGTSSQLGELKSCECSWACVGSAEDSCATAVESGTGWTSTVWMAIVACTGPARGRARCGHEHKEYGRVIQSQYGVLRACRPFTKLSRIMKLFINVPR